MLEGNYLPSLKQIFLQKFWTPFIMHDYSTETEHQISIGANNNMHDFYTEERNDEKCSHKSRANTNACTRIC